MGLASVKRGRRPWSLLGGGGGGGWGGGGGGGGGVKMQGTGTILHFMCQCN